MRGKRQFVGASRRLSVLLRQLCEYLLTFVVRHVGQSGGEQ
jgi:hypothetical protein